MCDVVVIGGGPIGLATALECARLGKKVTVLEASVFFNQAGSSGDLVRMFRTMYTESFMAELMHECQGHWKQLEELAKEPLIERHGLLNFGNPRYGAGGPEGTLLDPVKNLEKLKMPYRKLTATELQTDYPFKDLPSTYEGIFSPDNGTINVQALVRSLYRLCEANEVKLLERAAVTQVMVAEDTGVVTVLYKHEGKMCELKASKVAITCGAYVNHVLQPSFNLTLDISIWEMTYGYYSEDPRAKPFQCMWFQFEEDTPGTEANQQPSNLFYGFPAVPWGPKNLCRIAVDAAAPGHVILDPSERRNMPAAADLAAVERFLSKHVPSLDPSPALTGSCLQTNVFDNMYALGSLEGILPHHGQNVVVFTAGWAMKMVPMLGAILRAKLLNNWSSLGSSVQETVDLHFRLNRVNLKTNTPILHTWVPRPVSFSRGLFARRLLSIQAPKSSAMRTVPKSLAMRTVPEVLAMTDHVQLVGSSHNQPQVNEVGRVGVLGAGMAGLYTAMLLKDLGIKFEILEANSRAGGRVYTHHFSEAKKAKSNCDDYDYFDVGAMRFPRLRTMERVLGNVPWSLTNRLNEFYGHRVINRVPYYLQSPNQLSYFNGHFFSDGPDPYRVAVSAGGNVPDEFAQRSADDLASAAYEKWVKLLDKNFEEAFAKLQELDSFSVRAYMQRLLNYPDTVINYLEMLNTGTGLFDEAFVESVIDSYDFSSTAKPLPHFPNTSDLPDDPSPIPGRVPMWYCIDKGTEQLTLGMVSYIQAAKGSALHLNRRVTRLEPASNGQISVDQVMDGGQAIVSTYDHVVCTLPLGVLRQVDLSQCNLPFAKKEAFRTLHYDHSVKVAFRFKTRWWQDPEKMKKKPIFGGVTTTDLPIRVVVYPSYGLRLGPNIPGVLIVSYTWSQDADRMGNMREEDAIALCLRNLTELHGEIVGEEYTGEYFLHDWNADENALGAFALYGPGQFTTFYQSLIKPELDGRLHFAGEAASAHHGWIIGSLTSAYRSVYEILEHHGRTDLIERLKERWGTIDELEDDEPPASPRLPQRFPLQIVCNPQHPKSTDFELLPRQ